MEDLVGDLAEPFSSRFEDASKLIAGAYKGGCEDSAGIAVDLLRLGLSD